MLLVSFFLHPLFAIPYLVLFIEYTQLTIQTDIQGDCTYAASFYHGWYSSEVSTLRGLHLLLLIADRTAEVLRQGTMSTGTGCRNPHRTRTMAPKLTTDIECISCGSEILNLIFS